MNTKYKVARIRSLKAGGPENEQKVIHGTQTCLFKNSVLSESVKNSPTSVTGEVCKIQTVFINLE